MGDLVRAFLSWNATKKAERCKRAETGDRDRDNNSSGHRRQNEQGGGGGSHHRGPVGGGVEVRDASEGSIRWNANDGADFSHRGE